MAKSTNTKSVSQNYPRIEDDEKEAGCLDASRLKPHTKEIDEATLKKLIVAAIEFANQKSSREAFAIPETADENELETHYKVAAKDLFAYFHRYCDDPASTSQNLHKKHFETVCTSY